VCAAVATGTSREPAFLARSGPSQRYVSSCLPGFRPPPGLVPVHASSRRSLARSSPQAQKLRGDKSQRPVAHRLKREEICESSGGAKVSAPVSDCHSRVRQTSTGQLAENSLGDFFRRELGGGTLHPADEKEEKDIFVELMAGTRRLASAAVRKKWQGISFDNEVCADEDVVSQRFASSLVKLSRRFKRRMRGIWFGLKCASWSRARRNCSGKPGWPSPLRDQHNVLGLLSLVSCADKAKVAEGNRQMRWAARLFRNLAAEGIPVILENPSTSFLWSSPPFKKLLRQFSSVIFDFCGFGCPYRKRTQLLYANCDLSSLQWYYCSSRGKCHFTGKPHDHLTGIRDKKLQTSMAAAYPEKFCQFILDQLQQKSARPSPPGS
jgi:hypothetical protein